MISETKTLGRTLPWMFILSATISTSVAQDLSLVDRSIWEVVLYNTHNESAQKRIHGLGTAFLIDERGYFLTAAHVLQKKASQSFFVELPHTDVSYRVRIVHDLCPKRRHKQKASLCGERDLALLFAENFEEIHPVIDLSFRKDFVISEAMVWGYPDLSILSAEGPTTFVEVTSSAGHEMYRTSLGLRPGISGGPAIRILNNMTDSYAAFAIVSEGLRTADGKQKSCNNLDKPACRTVNSYFNDLTRNLYANFVPIRASRPLLDNIPVDTKVTQLITDVTTDKLEANTFEKIWLPNLRTVQLIWLTRDLEKQVCTEQENEIEMKQEKKNEEIFRALLHALMRRGLDNEVLTLTKCYHRLFSKSERTD